MSTWRSPRAPLLQALLERDFVIVSVDHRLAPETKLPDIVEDVRDAWCWIHDVGPGRFGIDSTRVAMGDGSVGAYLSLVAGYLFEPRPRALASFRGYGSGRLALDPKQRPREAENRVHSGTPVLSP